MNKEVKLLYGIGINDADYQLSKYITITKENGKRGQAGF